MDVMEKAGGCWINQLMENAEGCQKKQMMLLLILRMMVDRG